MPPKEHLSAAKIARLSRLDLQAALDSWGVPYKSSDRDLLLRAKLDEKIAETQSGEKSVSVAKGKDKSRTDTASSRHLLFIECMLLVRFQCYVGKWLAGPHSDIVRTSF